MSQPNVYDLSAADEVTPVLWPRVRAQAENAVSCGPHKLLDESKGMV
jgi:hypothetical protein